MPCITGLLYHPDAFSCPFPTRPAYFFQELFVNQVLIVDDSDINLTLIKHLVLKLGDCTPVLFAQPFKALAWCQSNLPDLLIVDYMMPELDGQEFIQAFRSLPGRDEIPVLMVTANDQKEVRYQALQGGANDFLTKPIDRVEFSARVRNMLALRTGQKYLADRALHLTSLVDEQTVLLRQREQELILRLSRAAEFRDPETGAHIQRMALYSQLIARELGLDEQQQKLLLEAAPMHDVGKIGIPDQILLKPGRLTPEEFDIMKDHARLGYELLLDSSSEILQAGAEIAYTHHEKWDGSGYPQGLAGEAIPLFGRIVAVADVFDALTSERPYKPAWPLEKAVDLLSEGKGQHFDPTCVDAFLGAWPEVLKIRERLQDH
jgi:putative two-component system response regulator